MFREYYQSFSLAKSISMIESREFGFASFEGWMLRHKSFKSEDELKIFLQSFVPLDAYSSCALYKSPEDEMDKKGWLSANLIFDIDADHIPTPCNKIHDEWTCGDCSFKGKGLVPESCPACGSKKLDVKTWPCEVCLDSAKTETVKLLDMLMHDFGFSEKDIRAFFSGHRGYHVHVENEVVESLDAIARKELVDYISGLGFDPVLHGFDEKGKKTARFLQDFTSNALGWDGRIFNGMHDFISNAKKEDLVDVGMKGKTADVILKSKDFILKNWKDSRTLSAVKGVGPETLGKILEFCLQDQSSRIDTVVTTDIHRLIRLPDTLHGKTGLKKEEFPIGAIDDYDPFKSSVAFKRGTVFVSVSDAPQFRLGDETFGPYKQKKIDLPMGAALLLVCKGKAEVLE
jgi:DNA primase small subunit